MRFLHTADLHLGRSFTLLGGKGERAREIQWETFRRITELCRSRNIEFLLIAGDLFDSNEVSDRLAGRVARELQELAPMPVLILPGTHDVLDEGSVYRRELFKRDSSNIFVFGLHGETCRVGNTAVHGYANITKQGGVHPLAGLAANREAIFNVAAVHGSLTIEGKHSPDDYVVEEAEIEDSGMDYVALGHWHSEYRLPTQVPACFSGAPEPTAFGEKAGQVLIVELGEGPAGIERVEVGGLHWLSVDIDVGLNPPGGPLEKEVASLASPDVVLRLKLLGTWPSDINPDVEALEEEFAGECFHLEVDGSGTTFPLEEVDGLFAAGTVGARFVEDMRDRIAVAGSEEGRALLEEALYLGAGFIFGRQGVG